MTGNNVQNGMAQLNVSNFKFFIPTVYLMERSPKDQLDIKMVTQGRKKT
jgi:hypothetical protein